MLLLLVLGDRDTRLKWVGEEQIWGKNQRFKTHPILGPHPDVYGPLLMCEREENPGIPLLRWVEEKKGRKRTVEMKLNVPNKSNTERTLNCKNYKDLMPFFNLFSKMQVFFCNHLWVFRFICVLCWFSLKKKRRKERNSNSNPRMCSHLWKMAVMGVTHVGDWAGDTDEAMGNFSRSFFFWPWQVCITKLEELLNIEFQNSFELFVLSNK